MNKKIKITALLLSGTLLATTSIASSISLVSCNEKDNQQNSDSGGVGSDDSSSTTNKKNVNVDGSKIFNELNGTLSVDDWNDKNKTKIKEQIKIGLKTSLDIKYKNKITLKDDSISITIPAKNNSGTIKFKVNIGQDLKLNIKNNKNVTYNDSSKLITVKNLVLKNDIKLDSELLFNTLNWKFTNQDWEEKTKLTDAIKNVLITTVGDDKNNIDCIINEDPVIPTSVATNDGTIKFKITTSKNVQFKIQTTSNVSFDETNNILSITNLNLIKPIEIAIDLNFANWIMKFVQDAYDRSKTGKEFANFLRTDLIDAISKKLGIDGSKYINPWNVWMDDGYFVGDAYEDFISLDFISSISIPFHNAYLVAKDAINIKYPGEETLLFNYQDNLIEVSFRRKKINYEWQQDEAVNFVNELIKKNNITNFQDLREIVGDNTTEIAKRLYYLDPNNNQKHYLNPNEAISSVDIVNDVSSNEDNTNEKKHTIYFLSLETKSYGLIHPDPGFVNDNIEKVQRTPTKEQLYKACNIIDTIAKNSKTKNEFNAITNSFSDILKDALGFGDKKIFFSEDIWFGNWRDGSSIPFYSIYFSEIILPYSCESNIAKNEIIFNELGLGDGDYMYDWNTIKVNDNLVVQYNACWIYFRLTPKEIDQICPDSQFIYNFNQDFYNELASIIEIDQYPTKWLNNKTGYCQYLNDTKNEQLMTLFNKYITATDHHHPFIYSIACELSSFGSNQYQDSFFIWISINDNGYLNRLIFDKNIPIKLSFYDVYNTWNMELEVPLPTANSSTN